VGHVALNRASGSFEHLKLKGNPKQVQVLCLYQRRVQSCFQCKQKSLSRIWIVSGVDLEKKNVEVIVESGKIYNFLHSLKSRTHLHLDHVLLPPTSISTNLHLLQTTPPLTSNSNIKIQLHDQSPSTSIISKVPRKFSSLSKATSTHSYLYNCSDQGT